MSITISSGGVYDNAQCDANSQSRQRGVIAFGAVKQMQTKKRAGNMPRPSVMFAECCELPFQRHSTLVIS